jgi:hypothetical protein
MREICIRKVTHICRASARRAGGALYPAIRLAGKELIARSSAAARSSMMIGLLTKSFMPTARHSSRACPVAAAESPMTQIWGVLIPSPPADPARCLVAVEVRHPEIHEDSVVSSFCDAF